MQLAQLSRDASAAVSSCFFYHYKFEQLAFLHECESSLNVFLNVVPLCFCQGAARRFTTQRKNLEVVESVGAAGKSDFNRSVKYFRQEVDKFDKCF